ncbi:MAG: diadenylate cyclase [Patescibacteria group bacterium]|jgi:DNA integrity scanning protein DisA with diadenylate cyclase activity
MVTDWWSIFISHLTGGLVQMSETAGLFWSGLISQFSLTGLLDLILVAALLWWLYRRLRRSELIGILPRIFILLIIILVARILGFWALFYVGGALFIITLLALSALYAPEIKQVLITDLKLDHHPRATIRNVSTADYQTAIKTLVEALAVLTRAHKPALIVIKRDKPLTRLVDNGTKMNSPLRADLLIDFFANGSVLGKGAAIIDGNKIIGAGSTLFRTNARILFNPTHPMIQRAARELNAVIIIATKTTSDINVVAGDNTYKNLNLADLSKLLQNILVYRRI